MRVEYYRTSVYGNERLYVKDGDLAEALFEMTKMRTINHSTIRAMRAFGVEFIEVVPPSAGDKA
jgi:hypothetical protein